MFAVHHYPFADGTRDDVPAGPDGCVSCSRNGLLLSMQRANEIVSIRSPILLQSSGGKLAL